MKKNILSFLLIFAVANFAYSQGGIKLKLAEKNFDNYAYPKALEYYLSLAEQNIEINHVNRRAAECYYYMGDVDKALEWYGRVIDQDDLKAEDVFRYSKVLRQKGNYKKADQWMLKYYKMVSVPQEAKRYEKTMNQIDDIKKQKKRCDLENLSLNTKHSDFGGFYHGSQFIFTSASKKNYFIKRIFSRDESPYLDIFHVNKNDMDSSEMIQSYPKIINSKFHDGPGVFSPDSNRFYFTRNNYYKCTFKKKENGLKIFYVEKKDGKWKNLKEVSFNSDKYSVGHPAFSADGKKFFFVSDMPGGYGGTDIYYAPVNADGTLGSAVNMGNKINTDGNEMFPFMNNEKILFFSSDGHIGLGGLDIFYALPDYKGDYEKVQNAGIPMNSMRDDFAFYLDENNQKGFISSNRDGGRGEDDIYSYNLLRPFKPQYFVKGEIKDKLNKLPLSNVVVTLRDANGKPLEQVISDEKGAFEFEAQPDTDYKIECNKEEYAQHIKPTTTKNMGEETILFLPLEMIQNTLTINCIITDRVTKKPLEGVEAKLINTKTGKEELSIITNKSGDFNLPLEGIKLNDLISYRVILKKEGYIGKNLVYTKRIKEYGIVYLHEELNVALNKIEKGLDLAKMIDLQPIYFDVGKSNIRPDAAKELDKIVEVMNENPKMIIELGSHTDSRGSASGNLRLSDRRAKSSAKYIISKGISKNRITGKGYGESRLVNKCKDGVKCTEEQHQENRRTEFIILKN